MRIWTESWIQFQTRFYCCFSFQWIYMLWPAQSNMMMFELKWSRKLEFIKIMSGISPQHGHQYSDLHHRYGELSSFELTMQVRHVCGTFWKGRKWEKSEHVSTHLMVQSASSKVAVWVSGERVVPKIQSKIDANCVRSCITRMPNYSIVCLHNIRISCIMDSCTRLKEYYVGRRL